MSCHSHSAARLKRLAHNPLFRCFGAGSAQELPIGAAGGEAAQLLQSLGRGGTTGEKVVPLSAEFFDPLSVLGAELPLEFLAQPVRQFGAMPSGRDGDLKVPALDDGRVIEVAVLRIVDGIAQHAAPTGLLGDLLVDGR